MVLKIQAPRGMTLTRLRHDWFKKQGCKTYPPEEKWLNIERAALLLGVPENKLLRYASTSPTIHGILFNDEPLLIHPEGVFKRQALKHRLFLKKEEKINSA